MTSVFDADGKNIPCTVIEAGPCVVTQIRTEEKDGYAAVQLAYDEKKEKHTSAGLSGHFKKAQTTPKKKIVEFGNDFNQELQLGDTITVADVFHAAIEWVDVTGFQKERFSGRCETSRIRRSRGRPMVSTNVFVLRFNGCLILASRVFKGKRLAGRMGGDQEKILN